MDDPNAIRLLEPEQRSSQVREQTCAFRTELGDIVKAIGVLFALEAASKDVEYTTYVVDGRPVLYRLAIVAQVLWGSGIEILHRADRRRPPGPALQNVDGFAF